MEFSTVRSISNLHIAEGIGGGRHSLLGTLLIASNFIST